MMKLNILIFLILCSNTFCIAQNFIVKDDEVTIATRQPFLSNSLKKNESAANDYIGFYQKYISGIRGQECPMYPSCSNYGLKTFTETNFLSAFVLTSDRLLRCGHDHNNYSLTLRDNGFKSLDYPAYDNAPLELYYVRNSYHFAYSDTSQNLPGLVFVKKLINNHYYQEALLEIMRIEFELNKFNMELFINKVICLKAIGEYEKALFEYETKCPKEYQSNNQLAFQIALIQFKLQNYDQSLKVNSVALEACNDTLFKPKILMLNGLLYANKYDWKNSMMAYQYLAAFETHKTIANSNYNLTERALRIKDKMPVIAGALSIIPGGGYLYTGHKQTAFSALVVNGLLAYATYTSIKNKNYGMGILTGVFNLSFYVGNIYGATKSAKRFNEKQRKSITNKLEYNSHF
jgi:putative component of membrane protein insertase Oxa1/YidC/SpoIIIJ protein YidD